MTTAARDYSLTGPSAKAAIESGLATADWYKTPIARKRMKELMQRSDGPAIRDTLAWLGLLVVLGTIGAISWFSWLSVLCFLAYGVLYGSGGDSRWHETGHGTAFKTRWMNDVVYQVACFMMMRNPTVWRWSHIRHHTDTIIVGRDPEIITPRPPNLGKVFLNWFGLVDVPLLLGAMVRYAFGNVTDDERDFIPETEVPKVARVARVWVTVYAATIVLCVVFGSIVPLLLIGLPRMYGAWHHLMTGMIQHLGLADDVTDHRLNSRTCYMNPVSRFVYWNMNYHVEHHMFPMVPFHRLPELHEEIKHDCAPASPNIATAMRELMGSLLEQRRNPEHYIDQRPLLATYQDSTAG
jgi:fatty acid desaturase